MLFYTTLLPVVTRLEQRFAIRKACIVADRGMISAATIAALEARGIDYILGVRERSTAEVRTEVIDDDGVAVPLTIARQKGETQLAVKEVKLLEPTRRRVMPKDQARTGARYADSTYTCSRPAPKINSATAGGKKF